MSIKALEREIIKFYELQLYKFVPCVKLFEKKISFNPLVGLFEGPSIKG